MLKSTPMTSKNKSMSSIFELKQDTPEMHPWYKFGSNATIICWVNVFARKNSKFTCWNRPPWPRKIDHGHPSSNLTKTLLRCIHGISLGPMRLIFVELSCFKQAKCWRTDRQTRQSNSRVGYTQPAQENHYISGTWGFCIRKILNVRKSQWPNNIMYFLALYLSGPYMNFLENISKDNISQNLSTTKQETNSTLSLLCWVLNINIKLR